MTIIYIILHALTTLFPTSVVNKFLPEFNPLGISTRQLLSWACSVVVGFIAAHFDVGVLGDNAWYIIAAKSLIAGLVANGIYKIGFVSKLLEILKLKPVS